jgi:hypothetical protein
MPRFVQQMLSKVHGCSYLVGVRYPLTAFFMTAFLLFGALLGGPVTVLCVESKGVVHVEAVSDTRHADTQGACCGDQTERTEGNSEHADCEDCVDIELGLEDGRLQESASMVAVPAANWISPSCRLGMGLLSNAFKPTRPAGRNQHPPPLLESWTAIRLQI